MSAPIPTRALLLANELKQLLVDGESHVQIVVSTPRDLSFAVAIVSAYENTPVCQIGAMPIEFFCSGFVAG